MKRASWIFVVFVFIVMQVGLIFVMTDDGKAKLLSVYAGMKMPIPEYIQFIFTHLSKFWLLPIGSLVLLGISLKRKSFGLQVLIILISLALVVGFYMAFYVAQPLTRLGAVV